MHAACLEHDPEKWKPVFRKDHAPPTLAAARFAHALAHQDAEQPALLEQRIEEK